MKEFDVTINGTPYRVAIEEVEGGPSSGPVRHAKPAPPAPRPAATVAVAAGDTPVNAPMPGKIVNLVASVGQPVKKGDVLLILEAMKMQNEISAPVDGTVKAFNVAAGQNVKPGEALAIIG